MRRAHWPLFTTPRQIVLTRIPSGAYSLASDLVRLMPAARVTLVGSDRAAGALPPTVVTLTIRPPPRRFMCGITSRQRRTAAISFSSRSSCQVASLTCSKPAAAEVPALFTSTSTPPQRARVAATNASTCSGRVTSAGIASTSAPVSRRTWSATRSSSSLRRAQVATRAPERAKRSTQARPRPSLPPVTITTLSLRPSSSVSMAPDHITVGPEGVACRRDPAEARRRAPGARPAGGDGRGAGRSRRARARGHGDARGAEGQPRRARRFSLGPRALPVHGGRRAQPPRTSRLGALAAGDVVLADRRRRELEPELRNVAAAPRRERVAVGPRPRAVARGVGVRRDRGLDLRDDLVHALAPEVDELQGAIAEPVVVGARPVHAHRGGAAVDPPADHLVAPVGVRPAWLHRDPGVHREDAAPAHRARRVDLHDRLLRERGIRRLPRGAALELPPVAPRAPEH